MNNLVFLVWMKFKRFKSIFTATRILQFPLSAWYKPLKYKGTLIEVTFVDVVRDGIINFVQHESLKVFSELLIPCKEYEFSYYHSNVTISSLSHIKDKSIELLHYLVDLFLNDYRLWRAYSSPHRQKWQVEGYCFGVQYN